MCFNLQLSVLFEVMESSLAEEEDNAAESHMLWFADRITEYTTLIWASAENM